jgi:hypothetical protein
VIRITGWDDLLQWWHVRRIDPWRDISNETPALHHFGKRPPIPA